MSSAEEAAGAGPVASRPALVCIVGPPASGKSLLIVSLTEAFRHRGRRVASAVLRNPSTTVVTLPNGARVTLVRAPAALELVGFVRAIEPNVDLVLAEGFSGPGAPTVEVLPNDAHAPATPERDLLAVVASTAVLDGFAGARPAKIDELAELIEARLLAPDKQEPPPARRQRGFLDRLRGR